MKTKFYILTILIIVFIGCDKNDKPSEQVPELVFNVDKNLVEENSTNNLLRFSINSPKNWLKVTNENLEEVRIAVEELFSFEEIFIYKLSSMYLNEESSSMMLVGEFLKSDTLDFNSTIKFYEIELKKNNRSEITSTLFYKDKILISQLLIRAENKINFRLFFENENKKMIQVDYISMEKQYPNEIKPIESSIGSIQLLNN